VPRRVTKSLGVAPDKVPTAEMLGIQDSQDPGNAGSRDGSPISELKAGKSMKSCSLIRKGPDRYLIQRWSQN
jgi:hypothetical protein